MFRLSSQHAIIVTWSSAVVALFAVTALPLTLATGSLLVLIAGVPSAVLIILAKSPPATLSETIGRELRSADESRKA